MKLSEWQPSDTFPKIEGVYEIQSTASHFCGDKECVYFCYFINGFWCGGWHSILDAQTKPKIKSTFPQKRKWRGVIEE